MAGGVALNCVINGAILRKSGFKRLWVQPAAGDAGGALGAAYAVYHDHLKNSRNVTGDKMQNALLGPSFTNDEIKKVLDETGLRYVELDDATLFGTVAAQLVAGKVIGWFSGRMEFGPRALGSRSIIADPRIADMQSVLNRKIKFRESFRPFAPAIMEDKTALYFDLDDKSPYMLVVSNVHQSTKIPIPADLPEPQGFGKLGLLHTVIPAVTHIDYTARVQTVSRETNARFYRLIEAFYELTKCPCIVNTSFNRMDEPIVNSPQNALACFTATGMDILILENFLIKKQ